MVRFALLPIVLLLAGVTAALAQGAAPPPPYYALPPVGPAVPQATGPVQQQILENYRTRLLERQREGLLRNPSGVGRGQAEIDQRIDRYDPRANPALPSAAGTAAAPGFGVVPTPPFNAAPLAPSPR